MNTLGITSIIGAIFILSTGIFTGTYILRDNRIVKINFIAYPLAILCYVIGIVGSIFIICVGFFYKG